MKLQEALESSAFPSRIKMMKLKIFKLINIFIPHKIKQKRIKLKILEIPGKHPFSL